MKKVQIFTDGSCLKNPGPGGWAAILRYQAADKVHEKKLKGGEAKTTNNKMELMAVIQALEALKEPCEIDLCSDSRYVLDGLNKWIRGWKKNGWMTADKKPVKNQELWMRLDEQASKHRINFNWIKGHAGHPENEECDEMAKSEATILMNQK